KPAGNEQGRRNFLKGSAAAVGAGLAASVPGMASAADGDCEMKNPYGARPGGGISLPDYY
ncbi:MAG TPA: ribonuclease Z, partial [Planctomycetaceae bacterium]|nr:ribonuclease Z [Planctomycetaceae bacterium]